MPGLLLTERTQPEHESIDILPVLRANVRTRGLPVVMLSRHGNARVRIATFDAGADDYVVKPCDAGELHARIRAVLRRRASYQHGDDILQANGLCLDSLMLGATAQTETGPRVIAPGLLEFRLLRPPVAHPQRMHPCTQLLDRVRDSCVLVGERTVGVHVRKLRVALANIPCDDLTQTVYGDGYRLVADTDDTTAAHAAEAIGIQLEAATRKTELLVYGHVPATHSLGPARLDA